ncbi:MAG: sulfatase/phosphatase domain-containing protein, partial [Candidatus Binatia bacterium]
PLIVRYPAALSPGVAIERRVHTNDLVPTLLSLVGVPAPGSLVGRSLMPLIRDPSAPAPSPLLHETAVTDRKALVLDNWKYIVASSAPQLRALAHPSTVAHAELYDLERDPAERTNLVGSRPEVAADLEKRLLDLLPEAERTRFTRGESIEIDQKTRERLRGLGYIQ